MEPFEKENLTAGIKQFKQNYESLIEQLGENANIDLVVKFCVYFRSKSIELYRKFEDLELNATIKEKLAGYREIYSSIYAINDVDYQCMMNYNNAIINGFGFHITNNVALEGIMKNGINSDIKTEDQQELEALKSKIRPDTFKHLFPFHQDITSKNIAYSCSLNSRVKYGYRPEWLSELESNYDIFKDDFTPEEKFLIEDFYRRASKKYESTSRVVVMAPTLMLVDNIPSYEKAKNAISNTVKDKKTAAEAVMDYVYIITREPNNSSEKQISPDMLITIDLQTKKLVPNPALGETEVFDITDEGHQI